jgi:hypothetical protein
VNPHVIGQNSFVFEGLATNWTDTGFTTVTESDMGLQFTGGVVEFLAEAAFTGCLLGESHMPLQVSFQSKCFTTVMAVVSSSRRGAEFGTVFFQW